jgi:hypothetical protein
VDVLVSGADRPSRDPLGRLLGRRAGPATVAGLAAVVVLTAVGGVLATGPVRAATERVALEVEVTSAVAVRLRGRDGVLAVSVRNAGARAVTLDAVEVDAPGLVAGSATAGRLDPGRRVDLRVPVAVRSCATLGTSGSMRLHLRTPGGGRDVVALRQGDAVLGDVLAAGCRPSEGVTAVRVRGLGGDRHPAGQGTHGVVLLAVANEGAALEELHVRVEVPGASLSTATAGPLGPGDQAVVRLSWQVRDCAALRRTGRVVVTARAAGRPPRELGFRVTEDEEARTVRDVDLDTVLRACADGAPVR